MAEYRHPHTGEVRTAQGPVADFLTNRGWVQVVPVEVIEAEAEAAAEDLKGASLDEALEANDLPKTGSADEKRQRLAEHLAKAGEFGYPANGEDPTDPIQDPTTVAPEEQS